MRSLWEMSRNETVKSEEGIDEEAVSTHSPSPHFSLSECKGHHCNSSL